MADVTTDICYLVKGGREEYLCRRGDTTGTIPVTCYKASNNYSSFHCLKDTCYIVTIYRPSRRAHYLTWDIHLHPIISLRHKLGSSLSNIDVSVSEATLEICAHFGPLVGGGGGDLRGARETQYGPLIHEIRRPLVGYQSMKQCLTTCKFTSFNQSKWQTVSLQSCNLYQYCKFTSFRCFM